MARLGISRRAAQDLEEIRLFSEARWGERVAAEYLSNIEEALNRLRENPGLLRTKPEFSRHLRFYRVQRHFLVCALVEDNIYLLAVRHGSLDLPNRLARLEPTLLQETDLLHQALVTKIGRTRRGRRRPPGS